MRVLSHKAVKMLLAALFLSTTCCSVGAADGRQRDCVPDGCTPICPPTCPPQGIHPAPVSPEDESPAPVPGTADDVVTENQPDTDQPQADFNQPQNQPQRRQSTANVARSGSRGDRAPNMIGDFFGTSGVPLILLGGGGPINGAGFPIGGLTPILGNLAGAPGGNVGRVKLTENTSIVPRDRYFVNYSFFNDARIANGINVHRVTPGFESTIFGNDTSVEVRFPLSSTIGNSVNLTQQAGGGTTEVGNMSVWLKRVIARNQNFLITTGLGLTFPTAEDYVAINGPSSVSVSNDSTHFLPFLGALFTPSDRLFAQLLVQCDIDGKGNLVSVNNLTQGRTRDNTFLFFDVAVGYWMYVNPSRSGAIKRIAPILEIHHNSTVTDGDALTLTNGQIVAAPGEIEVTNAVVGLTTEFGGTGSSGDKTMTVGYSTPLGGDGQFDGELRLFFTWRP